MTYISPCFYPTTTVLVDDDSYWLKSLVSALELGDKPHQTFYDPHHALDYLTQDRYRETFLKNLATTDEGLGGECLSFHPRSLVADLNTPKRFHQVSVLVVDYEMPGMKGGELCQRIPNPFVQKILLTGAADESIAVEAFNQGLIDCYIRKHDPKFLSLLQRALLQARQKYFQELFHIPLQTLIQRSESTALVEPVFIDFFNDLVKKHHIREAYLVESTGSFLMVGANKKLFSLITLDDDLLTAYCDAKSVESLSPKEVQALEKKELIPCYYNPFQAPYMETDRLKEFLRSPTLLKGAEKTFYAVFGEGFIQINPQDICTWGEGVK